MVCNINLSCTEKWGKYIQTAGYNCACTVVNYSISGTQFETFQFLLIRPTFGPFEFPEAYDYMTIRPYEMPSYYSFFLSLNKKGLKDLRNTL